MIRSFALLLALQLVHSMVESASSSDVTCENFTIPDEGIIEEVCAHHIFATESFNDTITDQVHTYNILKPVNRTAGEFPNCGDGIGIFVELAQRPSEGTCDVTINGAPCANCEHCDPNLGYVSVDCSVVPGGRVVECESNDYVFYPIEGYVSTNALTDDSEESPSSEQDPTDPPSEGATTFTLESSSFRCTAVSITVIVAAVGSILQL